MGRLVKRNPRLFADFSVGIRLVLTLREGLLPPGAGVRQAEHRNTSLFRVDALLQQLCDGIFNIFATITRAQLSIGPDSQQVSELEGWAGKNR